jgi:hypothetical protein
VKIWIVLLLPTLAMAQEREITQAPVQRDQQAAEFANPALREATPRVPDYSPLRPDERAYRTRERDAQQFATPSALPGRPAARIEPIPLPGIGR